MGPRCGSGAVADNDPRLRPGSAAVRRHLCPDGRRFPSGDVDQAPQKGSRCRNDGCRGYRAAFRTTAALPPQHAKQLAPDSRPARLRRNAAQLRPPICSPAGPRLDRSSLEPERRSAPSRRFRPSDAKGQSPDRARTRPVMNARRIARPGGFATATRSDESIPSCAASAGCSSRKDSARC